MPMSKPRTPSPFAKPDALAAVQSALRTLETEANGITALTSALKGDLGRPFTAAVDLIRAAKGRVIVTGLGKSGHIARKIAATFASTGTPAFFVHAGEASHGDLGMVTADDVFIGISYSGESEELLTIVPVLKRQGAHLISLTGNPNSSLALAADVHLDGSVAQEACPMGLAPTASTTAALALGDALAVALLDAKGFGEEDFARSHPGGSLGRRLLTHVRDVMHTHASIPSVRKDATLADAVLEISRKGLGMTAIVDDNKHLLGIYTDGDLRRTLEKKLDFSTTPVSAVMTANPRSIGPDALAVEAVQLMEQFNITQLVVVETNKKLVGALNMHDLLKAKVI